MNIYGFPTFNLTKVLITAEELGIDYQFHLLDALKGEHKTPEHLKRHPLGKVPAIEINGEHFFESNAICRLLAELNDNRMYGVTAVERAKVNQWIDFMGYHVGRWLSVFFFEEIIKPAISEDPKDDNAIGEAQGFLDEQLPALEQAIANTGYIGGGGLSIADTIAFAYFQTTDFTSVSLEKYPAIARWYATIKARPSYTKAMQKLPKQSINPFCIVTWNK